MSPGVLSQTPNAQTRQESACVTRLALLLADRLLARGEVPVPPQRGLKGMANPMRLPQRNCEVSPPSTVVWRE